MANDSLARQVRQLAAARPAVEKHHRLYPECVDAAQIKAAQIKAARVEAMLCRTHPERVEEYGFASTFYIELEDEGVG
jgi:hypothetical protein